MRRKPGCLSPLQLDQLAADEPGASSLRPHVEGCAACQARLSRRAEVAVPPVDLPTSSGPAADRFAWLPPLAPRRGRWLAGGLLGGLTALFALVLLRPTPPEERTKGAVALRVFALRAAASAGGPGGARAEELGAGDRVFPGDALRFEIVQARRGFVVILGLDARPSVTVYAPGPDARADATGPGRRELPETIVADETLGDERIVALVCPEPPDVDRLRRAAEQKLAEAGAPGRLPGLALPCDEASLLVTKSPRP